MSLERHLLHLNTLPLSTNKQHSYSFPPTHQTDSIHFSRSKNTHRHACTHSYTHPGRERVKSATWVTHTPLPLYLHTGASAKGGTPPLQTHTHTHKYTHIHTCTLATPLPSLFSSPPPGCASDAQYWLRPHRPQAVECVRAMCQIPRLWESAALC